MEVDDRPTTVTVLVAEDDDDIRSLVAATLERAGHSVLQARDGEEAVRLAAEHYPDLAVLDIGMPGTDGYELTRRLRRHGRLRDIPIIMITARTLDRQVAEGFEAGADDYLKKPFGPLELRTRVEAALRKVRRVSEAHSLAHTDALTGLPNRRAIDDALIRMTAQAHRADRSLAAAMLDLDGFKQLNDDCGHAAGDRALAAVAGAIRSTVRASDFAGRYGGDEFLILLPQTDRDGASTIAEKLRVGIAALSPPAVERPLSASVGVAVMPSDSADATVLARSVDRALYAAKSGGGNRAEP